MNPQTLTDYQKIIGYCEALFLKKNQDYGTSWRILRLPSLTDQIFIKAQRIRSIQEKGTQKVADDLNGEFVGIINYCIMALIQSQLPPDASLELDNEVLEQLYTKIVQENIELLTAKNHDYGEAWRSMRVSSITDIILMKLLRIKQIEDNKGKTQVSEGVESGYRDMINYAVFALILSDFGV